MFMMSGFTGMRRGDSDAKTIISHNTAFGDIITNTKLSSVHIYLMKKRIWQYYRNAKIVYIHKYTSIHLLANWWYRYTKMWVLCYLQTIRCYVIYKMTISCYVLCKIKLPLLCDMCWNMASAMCYVKPIEGPRYYFIFVIHESWAFF